MSREEHWLKYNRVAISGLIQYCGFSALKSLWFAVIYFLSEEFSLLKVLYTDA